MPGNGVDVTTSPESRATAAGNTTPSPVSSALYGASRKRAALISVRSKVYESDDADRAPLR